MGLIIKTKVSSRYQAKFADIISSDHHMLYLALREEKSKINNEYAFVQSSFSEEWFFVYDS